MIAHIQGIVEEIAERKIVIAVGGIGYSIATNYTGTTKGAPLRLETQLIIRDDAHELYGFATREERDFFCILIGVSGVGPRTALGMLSLYTLPDLVRIIRTGDAKAIALVPGIGKKTAEKVVIDLKDKVEGFASADSKASTDLIEALLSLGYKEHQIRTIASTIDTNLPIEKQITEALRVIKT